MRWNRLWSSTRNSMRKLLRSASLKRAIDVLGAVVGLAVFALPMAVIGIAVWWSMGRPVLFRQTRPGLHGRPFVLYKFRTMTDARDEQGQLLPDEQRLTRLGRWLRATSLDELPQLWNVLKGDMSLVGPRPLLMRYMPYFTARERRRFDMKPGMTGLAQVSGRNTLSWAERLELDARYVDEWNLLLDLRLLAVTVPKVLRRSGVVEAPHTLVPLDEERQKARSGLVDAT